MRHGDAAYRSLYKQAVGLIEAHSWGLAREAAAAMVAAATADAGQARRAVQAAGKFLGYLPEAEAAALLAELIGSVGGLPAAAADDLLGLLCSAAQRSGQPALLHEAVLMACACDSLVLRQAALLLPALGAEGERSLQPMMDAVAEAEGSLAALELHLDSEPLPLSELRRNLAVASAAFQAGNALRRLLSGDRSAAAAPGSAVAAAGVLELLAGIVGVGGRVSAAGIEAAPLPFPDQAHAAAVALATAARLRAAADSAAPTSSPHVQRLLGWDCLAEATPPGSSSACPVEPSELAWLASALFNVGVDLHAAGRFAAAVLPLRDALSVAGACLDRCAVSSKVRWGIPWTAAAALQ